MSREVANRIGLESARIALINREKVNADVLEALKAMVEWYEYPTLYDSTSRIKLYKLAKDAIAKAEGEPKHAS